MSSMNIDQTNKDTPVVRLVLKPVKPLESGKGLPYAPENWPNPGDTWRWRVGPRVNCQGYFKDRYLYPPSHLPGLPIKAFRSKRSLEHYVRLNFPKADIRKFLNSFSWIIPSIEGITQRESLLDSSDDEDDNTLSDITVCKAGNDKCDSLKETERLPTMPCGICCGEASFCSDCCCILCCKSVSLDYEGYSYVRCEAVVSDGYICGHVAHLRCAIKGYMCGTVGGSIGLDGEYYCRRCDARKDLVPHVNKFLEICQSIESQSEVEKILNLGVCILRGSQRDEAKELLNCIESIVIKLKCDTRLEVDSWNDDTRTLWSGNVSREGRERDITLQSLKDLTPIWPMPFNREAEMHRVKEEIHEVLKALRKAQETEYEIAKGKLLAQKECLDDLYKELEKEKSKLSRNVMGSDGNNLMTNVLKRLDQIKKEDGKLKEMEEVAKGFGRTSKGILEEHFNLRVEE